MSHQYSLLEKQQDLALNEHLLLYFGSYTETTSWDKMIES